MSDDGRFDAVLNASTQAISKRPRAIIVTFLLLTAVFAVGLGDITQEEGFQSFADDAPAQAAQETVEQKFEPPFEQDGETTQFVQRGENVLTRDALLEMLQFLETIETSDQYRVEETSSVASAVAEAIDPTANTLSEQRRTIKGATNAEIKATVRELTANPGLQSLLSDDLNPEAAEATATFATVSHEPGTDIGTVQGELQEVATTTDAEIIVSGSGLLDEELAAVIGDSLTLIIPVVIVLILVFLVVAYRDPIDLLLGLLALIMAIIWTFGFTGHAGIPFSNMMIAVPPLLLAIGIDFGIHAINRYREERVSGRGIEASMQQATEQLLVAFFIVTGTTVIGFGANMTSSLAPIQEFGIVASVGIIFTFLIFGIFLPAVKIQLDQLRDQAGWPQFATDPIGSGESRLGTVLTGGLTIGQRAPMTIILAALVVTAGASAYATTIDTTFTEEDFLPPEELPAYVDLAPGPLAPAEYTTTATINFIAANFETSNDDEVTVYLEGQLHEDHSLASIARAGREPPETVVTDGTQAQAASIIDVMHQYAQDNPAYAQRLAANDLTNNGVPDRNVAPLITELFDSDYEMAAKRYVTEDLRSTRVIYTVSADAKQAAVADDARTLAVAHRLDGTATGQTVVFDEITSMILSSSLRSLGLAVVLTILFLIGMYTLLEGRPWLALANTFPIVVTVAILAGTMAVAGIPLNALTGTALSITIGVGVAYSVHITHRFIDEYNESADAVTALDVTLRGTGGALTGSMLTTLGGAGSLVLAITPLLGQFGLLMVISVIYSYVTAIVLLPPALLVWEQQVG